MKIKIITGALVVLSFCTTSCNDSFMQEDPQGQLAESNTLKTTNELVLYLNTLYPLYIEGHQNGWSDNGGWSPLNVPGSHLHLNDVVSDNSVRANGVSNRLDNSMKSPQSGSSTGWEWGKMRTVNYFLRNYTKAEASVNNPEELNKYAAEAYFFKAYDYSQKLLYLGEVPWLTKDLNIDSEELFAPRTPRVELVDSIMKCLDFAVEHAIESNDPTGRINKDMANFLKARFTLFEGTFRKYHTELGLTDTSKELLKECVKACRAIMNTGNYQLFNNGSKDPYWKLFTFKNTPQADGNTEAILARVYDGDNLGHAAQKYYEYNDFRGNQQGATRALVDEYLCEDGRPIYVAGSEGSYEKNPLFKGYDGLWEELDNRDPRLRQTIAKPGEYITIYDRTTGNMGLKEVGIFYPGVSYRNGANIGGYQTTVTGYRYIKHWMGDVTQARAITQGSQTAIEFRYGEVLLMLAEAEAELGNITNSVLDETVNLLRERAGYDFTKYPSARLSLQNIPVDPRLDAINQKYLDYSVSPILREIRRERRVEMAQEGIRYFDLMRWKAGGFFRVPLRGMKMTKEKQKIYDGSLVSGVVNPTTGVKEYAAGAIVDKDVFLDNDGFIICYPRSPRVNDGILPWDERSYYFPIPIEELILNKNLKQNPGWEGLQ